MDSEELRRIGEVMVEFDKELEDLVLTAFARGAKVEGTFGIEAPTANAPGWIVTITRVESDGDTGYEPSVIEE